MRAFGIEEEFLLVDAETGAPRPVGQEVIDRCSDDRLTSGITQEQIGTATRLHRDVNDLALDLARCRTLADGTALRVGARIAALAMSPQPVLPLVSPGTRTGEMQERSALTADEHLTSGCHVRVEVEDDDEGMAVLDRIRVWLPVLLALSANSPFWNGTDTGYASYRSKVRGSRPLAARLQHTYPTLDVRVSDVCLYSDDAVLLALLTRGLVETAARAWHAGVPAPEVQDSAFITASWRAGRFGMDGLLLHPVTATPQDAGAVALALLQHVRPVLRDQGDAEIAESLLRQLLARGTGSRRQRAALLRRGDLRDVVSEAVRVTNLPRGGITDQHEAAARPAPGMSAGPRGWGRS